jgi:hypothetical protein
VRATKSQRKGLMLASGKASYKIITLREGATLTYNTIQFGAFFFQICEM